MQWPRPFESHLNPRWQRWPTNNLSAGPSEEKDVRILIVSWSISKSLVLNDPWKGYMTVWKLKVFTTPRRKRKMLKKRSFLTNSTRKNNSIRITKPLGISTALLILVHKMIELWAAGRCPRTSPQARDSGHRPASARTASRSCSDPRAEWNMTCSRHQCYISKKRTKKKCMGTHLWNQKNISNFRTLRGSHGDEWGGQKTSTNSEINRNKNADFASAEQTRFSRCAAARTKTLVNRQKRCVNPGGNNEEWRWLNAI